MFLALRLSERPKEAIAKGLADTALKMTQK